MSEHRLCALAELPDIEARRFVVDGHKMAVVRIGDAVHAIGDVCSHQNISLSEGDVHPEACELECWKHGSAFSLRTGRPNSLPATRAVPVFPIRLDGDDVWVEVP